MSKSDDQDSPDYSTRNSPGSSTGVGDVPINSATEGSRMWMMMLALLHDPRGSTRRIGPPLSLSRLL